MVIQRRWFALDDNLLCTAFNWPELFDMLNCCPCCHSISSWMVHCCMVGTAVVLASQFCNFSEASLMVVNQCDKQEEETEEEATRYDRWRGE